MASSVKSANFSGILEQLRKDPHNGEIAHQLLDLFQSKEQEESGYPSTDQASDLQNLLVERLNEGASSKEAAVGVCISLLCCSEIGTEGKFNFTTVTENLDLDIDAGKQGTVTIIEWLESTLTAGKPESDVDMDEMVAQQVVQCIKGAYGTNLSALSASIDSLIAANSGQDMPLLKKYLRGVFLNLAMAYQPAWEQGNQMDVNNDYEENYRCLLTSVRNKFNNSDPAKVPIAISSASNQLLINGLTENDCKLALLVWNNGLAVNKSD